MQLEGSGAERHRRGIARRTEAERIGVAVGHAQAAHHRHQRNVDDVVLRSATVRIAGVVAAARQDVADDAEPVLRSERHGRDRGIEAQHLRRRDHAELVHARDAGQEGRHQIVAAGVARRERARRLTERDFNQRRQRRVGDVVRELGVVLRTRAVEAVLVGQADHHLVDERHAEARHLGPVAAGHDRRAVALARTRRQVLALAQARRRPAADHRVRGIRDQARGGDLELERGHVLVGQAVYAGIDQRRIGDHRERRIDQVENDAEVDRERILALAHEQAARNCAPRDVHGIDVLGGIADVVGDRLGADVVDRLVERRRAGARVGQRRAGAGATVAANDVDGVALVDVERGRVDVGDLPRLDQRDRHGLVLDRQGDRLERVLELELEGDVLLAVADVVDVDLVERVRVEREVVGAAVRVLQRQVVSDQRHEAGAAAGAVGGDALVAVEHVEVGPVDLRLRRDERRLPVTRGQGVGDRVQGPGRGEQRHQPPSIEPEILHAVLLVDVDRPSAVSRDGERAMRGRALERLREQN